MRRDRSVIFRLTDAEYAQLEAAARASGARSVSDYIRGAVLDQMAGGTLTERVAALERWQARAFRNGDALEMDRPALELASGRCR